MYVQDLLIKYIDILECCSGTSSASTSTVTKEESSNWTPSCVKIDQPSCKKSDKPPEAALGKMPNLQVIDLVTEDADCNVLGEVIVLDDSKLDEAQKSEVSNNCNVYFVDKALSSFESPSPCCTKTKKRKIPQKNHKKTKRNKRKTIESEDNKVNNKILKELNGQSNCTNTKDISGSNNSEGETETIVPEDLTPEISLIEICSDDEVVMVDEEVDSDIIVLDSPVPQLHVSANFPIQSVCPSRRHKLEGQKLIKSVKKQGKKLFKKCKKLPSPTPVFFNVKKKHFKAWSRPAHLSPNLTQIPSNVPCGRSVGSNIYNPNVTEVRKEGLRPVIIDGSNVAIGHGRGVFSMRGLQICVDYFLQRGHRHIKVFVPQFRVNQSNFDEVDRMEKNGTLILTPSRRVEGKLVVPYDDRFIIQYAAETSGIVVSSDNYRDLYNENPVWKETIDKRLLMFTWVDDVLMFPQDPLGRKGPTLDEFLRY